MASHLERWSMIKDDPLQIKGIGHAWCEEFRKECFADPSRFYQRMTKRKVNNLSSAAVKAKPPGQLKIRELQCTRDLF